MKARGLSVQQGFDGKVTLTVEIDRDDVHEARRVFDELRDKELDVSVKKYWKKRSISANDYCWSLIGQLAEKLDADPMEIYRHHIQQIGVRRITDLPEKDIDAICHAWRLNGDGWLTTVLDYGDHPDTKKVCLWYGSSVYNTKQMSRLIDNIVQDCKEQGIETRTPAEIERMVSLWGQQTRD